MEPEKDIRVGDSLHLGHHSVFVLKIYDVFQLVRVRYADETQSFIVDRGALTTQPDRTHTLSLRLLQKSKLEEPSRNER